MQCNAEVLIVDDSQTQLMLIQGIFECEERFLVRTANNGQHALELINQSPPDLVITDLQMPDMNGLELVEALKQAGSNIPVILITSQGSEDIATKALHVGAASYVPKRDMAHDLVPTARRVMEVLEQQKLQGQIAEFVQSTSLVLSCDNRDSLVPALIARIEAMLTEVGTLDEGERMQVSMALDEAILNAMVHGNLEVSSALREIDDGKPYRDLITQRQQESPYKDRRVRIDVRADNHSVTITITDEGHGFDVSSLPDPTDPANLENIGGRGLYMINAFMDEVQHNQSGNQITLVKRAGGGEG